MSDTAGNNNHSASSTEWMNMLTEFWSPIMDTWATTLASPPPDQQQQENDGAFESFFQIWQTMMNASAGSNAAENQQQASEGVPDVLMGVAQTCMRGFTRFQEHFNQWLDDKGKAISLEDSESLKKAFLSGLSDAYEKEFRQFFKMPQIGLGRVYQERVLEAADKHNLFQVAFSNFMHQLSLPMEEAFDQLHQLMVQHSKNEEVAEDPKTYYNMWVKILEGRYMELFKKPDFSQLIGKTLAALNEYSMAKQTVVNDMLKQHSIPTHQDLDELYKEIHLLKKRMRLHEKKR